MDLEETEARNDYAGKDQQQFNRSTDISIVYYPAREFVEDTDLLKLQLLQNKFCRTW
jgi:hypothetical protein